jgi:UDP-3-O-[3-hydroxymyristoyl] N-acetylglucosamine deacetylase/3-hydroxyacyl-[acyl-carrier-protein] dehydratase
LARLLDKEKPPAPAPFAPPMPQSLPVGEGALDILNVMKILPHRYPFLMVDRVLKIEGGQKIVALKNITINEPFFQGHYPGHPIMPGVLQLEAMAQVAGILMLHATGNSNKLAYFMSANNVKWRRPVLPGDQLVIEVEMGKMRSKIAKAQGVCKVNGEIASEAEVLFSLVDRS